MYLPGLKDLVAEKLSRQPDEASYPDDTDTGHSGSGPHILHDPLGFGVVKN